MTTRLFLADREGSRVASLLGNDTAPQRCVSGTKQLADVVACSPGQATIPGVVSPNGDLVLTMRYGGSWSQAWTAELNGSPSGANEPNRQLQFFYGEGQAYVRFGTDAAGTPIVPTAGQVAALVNAYPGQPVTANAGGDGSGGVATASAPFAGGADDGDVAVFSGSALLVARKETL